MIHALPGLGADQRIYPLVWSTLSGFTAHDWAACSNDKSLSSAAATICRSDRICDGDSLIGSSLGGMVACEITKIRKIKKLFLVGSAIRKDEINSLLKFFHPLSQIAPIDWLRFSAGKIPSELTQMFAETDTAFMRSMCAAVFEWPGLVNPITQIFRIHGKYDMVIPPPKDADLLLNGGHVISMTHANECVAFIRKQIVN